MSVLTALKYNIDCLRIITEASTCTWPLYCYINAMMQPTDHHVHVVGVFWQLKSHFGQERTHFISFVCFLAVFWVKLMFCSGYFQKKLAWQIFCYTIMLACHTIYGMVAILYYFPSMTGFKRNSDKPFVSVMHTHNLSLSNSSHLCILLISFTCCLHKLCVPV